MCSAKLMKHTKSALFPLFLYGVNKVQYYGSCTFKSTIFLDNSVALNIASLVLLVGLSVFHIGKNRNSSATFDGL